MRDLIDVFRNNLSEIMSRRKITQTELAELCDMHTTQINGYLAGRMKPKLEIIERIARALKIPVTELIGDPTPLGAPARQPTAAEIVRFVVVGSTISEKAKERILEVLKDEDRLK